MQAEYSPLPLLIEDEWWKLLRKDDAVKVLHSICQQIWKTALATGLENVSFDSSPKEGNAKECSDMDISLW